MENKTVFIATHKLSMLRYVDEVLYIENGIVYQGIHKQLLAEKPSYMAFLKDDIMLSRAVCLVNTEPPFEAHKILHTLTFIEKSDKLM